MKRQRNSFLTPLVVEVMPSGKRFKLHHDFTYHWLRKGWDIKIIVPAGFITDFASIPRLARAVIPKLGLYNKAAVIHDFLYQGGFVPSLVDYTRLLADNIFRDGMRDLGVAQWKIKLMYWAVRIGGYFAWRKRV